MGGSRIQVGDDPFRLEFFAAHQHDTGGAKERYAGFSFSQGQFGLQSPPLPANGPKVTTASYQKLMGPPAGGQHQRSVRT